MGAEGGVIICKTDDIRKYWPEIKIDILERLRQNGEYSRDKKYFEEKALEISSLPDSIINMSNKELINFIRNFTRQYDTPYLFENTVTFADGTNIDKISNSISGCFPGDCIQTWS